MGVSINVMLYMKYGSVLFGVRMILEDLKCALDREANVRKAKTMPIKYLNTSEKSFFI